MIIQNKFQENDLIDYNIDEDYKIIPFSELKPLIDVLPRNSNKRIALLWLIFTGARVCEIENRNINEIIFGKYWVWQPRKKQTKMRKEKLPLFFWEEFSYYLDNAKFNNKDIFGLKGESLSRQFNRDIRKKLGGNWIKKKPQFKSDGTYNLVYIYQLKNIRHNFVTYQMFKELQKEMGPEVALGRVSIRMCHSSKHITTTHYI